MSKLLDGRNRWSSGAILNKRGNIVEKWRVAKRIIMIGSEAETVTWLLEVVCTGGFGASDI